jgi:hypothetical protein
MNRHILLPMFHWLLTASLAGAQENPGEKKPNAAVICLFEVFSQGRLKIFFRKGE